MRTLSPGDKNDLLGVLGSYEPSKFEALRNTISNEHVARVFGFYKPLTDDEEREIWELQKLNKESKTPLLPDDERVEDAGLEVEPVLADAK